MTQYDSLLWLDSDTVVADSLHTIFLKVDGWGIKYLLIYYREYINRLMSPTDTSPGPRIGMSYDRDYYAHFLEHGRYPPLDVKFYADSNSGVFLIKPGDSQVGHHGVKIHV